MQKCLEAEDFLVQRFQKFWALTSQLGIHFQLNVQPPLLMFLAKESILQRSIIQRFGLLPFLIFRRVLL